MNARRAIQRGLTLIELVIVIVIVAIMATFTAYQSGTISFWREEGFIRRLSETIVFLHHQAVVDQAYYRLQFDIEKHTYQVGVMQTEAGNESSLAAAAADAGTLTLELAGFLSPSIGRSQSMIPPPSFPSLAEPVEFPRELSISDIRTMRGKTEAADGGTPYILFSPRGFSEFAVIHLENDRGQPFTILVNPFTGLTDIYHEYKDFVWTYSKDKGGKSDE